MDYITRPVLYHMSYVLNKFSINLNIKLEIPLNFMNTIEYFLVKC